MAAAVGLAAPSPVGAQAQLDLWALPLENRADLSDIIGRNLSEATRTRGGRLRVRGAGTDDQLTFIDGFRLDRLARVPLAGLSRVSVTTVGLPAALADAPGAAIGLRTRPLDDRFRLGVELTRDQVNDDPPFTERSRSIEGMDGYVSGPLVPGRLRQLLAWRLERASHAGRPIEVGFAPRPDTVSPTASGLLKLELRLHRDHELSFLAMADAGLGLESSGGEPAANPRYTSSGLLLGGRWSGRFPGGLSAGSQLSFQRSAWEEDSGYCLDDSAGCRHRPPLIQHLPFQSLFNNWLDHAVRRESSLDLATTLRWEGGSSRLAHRVRLTSRLRASRSFEARSVPGDHVLEFNGDIPVLRRDFFVNDPRLDPPGRRGWSLFPGQAFSTVHALEDELRISGGLQVTAGLAFISATAEGPLLALQEKVLAPNLRVGWTPARLPDTSVGVASGWRFADDLQGHVRLAAGQPFSRVCRWDPSTQLFDRECTVHGGPLSTAHPGAKDMARTWEHSIWAAHALGRTTFRAEAVHRETVDLDDLVPSTDGTLTGSDDLVDLGHLPRPLHVARTAEPAASRRHLGLTLSAAGHLAGAEFSLGYTLARLTDDNGRDPAADRRHVVRALTRYGWRDLISVGLIYRMDSGLPYSFRVRDDRTGTYVRRLPVGRGPGLDLNDPRDDVDLQLPRSHQLNLQLRVGLHRLIRARIDFFLDVINAFDSDAVTAVGEWQGRDFGLAAAQQARRRTRIGLAYRH